MARAQTKPSKTAKAPSGLKDQDPFPFGSLQVCQISEGPDFEAFLTQAAEDLKRQCELASQLAEKDPALGISAFIIAGDMMSAELATKKLKEEGGDPLKLLKQVGSYSKLAWCYEHLPRPQLLKMLPALWAYSDPDDTDPRFIALWVEAWEANRRKLLYDKKPLPKKRDGFAIYRGQRKGAKPGISWTLQEDTARRFGKNGGLRSSIPNGIVYEFFAEKPDIMGYLTGRNEAEIIIHPRWLETITEALEEGGLIYE